MTMATPEPDSERIVITDTNILINLVIAGRAQEPRATVS